MTGVSGASVVVRSTTRIRFAFSSSTNWVSTLDCFSAMFPSVTPNPGSFSLVLPQRLQRPLELEAVLQQRQIHVERFRSDRLDLRNDCRQLAARQGVGHR